MLIPLAALVLRAAGLGWEGFFNVLWSQRVAAAFRVTFGLSLIAAAIDSVIGSADRLGAGALSLSGAPDA